MISSKEIKNVIVPFIFCFVVFFNTPIDAKVVYVSSLQGNDINDGLTSEAPLYSIAKAIEIGDTVLLKSGDIFYENVNIHKGLISKYGGNKLPILRGYKRIIKPKWQKADINIWRISLAENNYSGFDTHGSSMDNNIGCIYEYDKKIIHGRKQQYKNQLMEDWDIWQTEKHTREDAKASDFDSLYLYLKSDPNKLKLEFTVTRAAAYVTNATIENIRFEGFGFGISAGTKSVIRNCEIDVIGGRTQLSPDYVCYGNGIEFWITEGLADCLVEHNIISRCYDCGCTIQGRDASPRNIRFNNNVIIDCCEGWEDFITNSSSDVVFQDCVFENNLVINSGNTSGFGYPEGRNKFCHILGNNYLGNKGMIFCNNTFIGGNYLCAAEYQDAYKSNVWNNNTCYIKRGEWLLKCTYKGLAYVEVPLTKGGFNSIGDATNYAITRYRELCGDNTTRFVVMSKKKIDRRVSRLEKKYIKK